MTEDFDIEHKGVSYWVVVEFERTWVDDSFDHDWGGRTQTEECGHWEVDPDDWNVSSCTDETGQEVDIDDVPGLEKAILEHLLEMEVDD